MQTQTYRNGSVPSVPALRRAFDVRYRYQDLGLLESHDMLQQMMGLVNMLTIADDTENAVFVLSQYEAMVTEHEGNDSFDYGCCKFAAGVIALKEGCLFKPKRTYWKRNGISLYPLEKIVPILAPFMPT
jgi:hypothetical protein